MSLTHTAARHDRSATSERCDSLAGAGLAPQVHNTRHSMNHEHCGKECVGLKCNDGCIVYPGGVARSTPELIRAYERGANRTLLLEEALLASDDDYDLPDELVDRLFMRPSGEALEIPAWHEGGRRTVRRRGIRLEY